jgi:hypothetical protein
MNGSALTLLLFLAVIAWFAFRPARPVNPSRTPSVTPLRGLWQWLRVLGCRVVSLSRRVAPRVVYRRVEVREHGGGALITSNEGAAHHQPVRALKRVHPLVPPAAPAPVDPRVQLDAWVRRELTDPQNRALRAHVIREAARVHRVSKRTAQRAVQRIAGGAR